MTIREQLEQNEHRLLQKGAAFADESLGRLCGEPPCPIRTCFMRDRDRIVHSKAFRRLKHKTQVFLSPEGDHYRTRLTHTLEVSQVARTIARATGLNEDLTEAAALGHDLGHTPFGHAGEKALNAICPDGFAHNVQSLRVVDLLEKDGRGLNLSLEVRDGIVCHTGLKKADTLEGQIIHYADRIAYLSHDIDDSIRAGILKQADIPRSIVLSLGESHKERIDTLVRGAIDFLLENDQVGLPPHLEEAMDELRAFLFDQVYTNPTAKSEEVKGIDILKRLYEYYSKHLNELPPEFLRVAEEDGAGRAVCDYIAGMTDRYAISAFSGIFIPKSWAIV